MDEIIGSGSGSENVLICILFVIIYIIATVNMKKLKKMGKKRSRNKSSSLLLVHTVRTTCTIEMFILFKLFFNVRDNKWAA